MALASWINADETAKDMLSRVLLERPLLLIPPLHRVPLRVGNVVEIVGPSPSAKTEVLIQAAVSCILPKEWGGLHYGGLERLVIYIDLDCHFDVHRLSQSLKHRISEVQEFTFLNEEVFQACLRRFLYIRCYNSYELLAVLKTMQSRLQKETKSNGVSAHFLMIDSIGAFYWVDRASKSLPLDGNNRKTLSLQSVAQTVVHEIHQLIQAQPMLVLVTKATILGIGALASDMKRTTAKCIQQDCSGPEQLNRRRLGQYVYQEYMPSVWQIANVEVFQCMSLSGYFHHYKFRTNLWLEMLAFLLSHEVFLPYLGSFSLLVLGHRGIRICKISPVRWRFMKCGWWKWLSSYRLVTLRTIIDLRDPWYMSPFSSPEMRVLVGYMT